MRPANNCRPAWQAPHLVAPGPPAGAVTTAVIELRAGAATATIDPERGGRITSLRVGHRELLIGPPDDADRGIRWGAFLMAPWAGRLADARVRFRGDTFQLQRTHGRHAIHGLVWSAPWDVVRSDDASADLQVSLSAGGWPFGGEVSQRVRLGRDGLAIEASVMAGAVAMPAALGWHPWFRRDAVGGDPELELRAAGVLERRAMLPTGEVLAIAGKTDLRHGPRLGRRRLDDAFVGARSPAHLRGTDLDLRVGFGPECGTVVVYSPPEAVCIEPQTARPNALGVAAAAPREERARILHAGATLTATVEVRWRSRTSSS